MVCRFSRHHFNAAGFVLRLLYLAERQTTIFGRVYGYGVTGVFIFHIMVNIGMVIGIMPVIGIPLPFFSYGGSSLWGIYHTTLYISQDRQVAKTELK